MNGPCEEFADRIVDYADGELPEAEAQALARHLTACAPCRRTVEALNRSLGLAKVLWGANLGEHESVAQSSPVRNPRRIRFYAVAASVFFAASAFLFIIPTRHWQRSPTSLEDMEQQVVRAGIAAELLAATRIVAQCEGTESIVEQQYRYILREYAETPAAESVRSQYGSLPGGIQ